MTIKRLEIAISDGEIEESKIEKLELVIDATRVLSKTIQEELECTKMHNQATCEFLHSKHFKDAMLDAILFTLEYKETSNPLKRSELKLLKHKKATHAHYIEVCEKLSAGIVYAIGVSDADDDTQNLMLQEIMSHYIETLENKMKLN